MAIRIHVQAARRAMILATFGAALVVGLASGEELPSQPPTGQWVLTPITPTTIPPGAWLHNSRTGELFLCHQVISKDPPSTAAGVCLPMPLIPLGPSTPLAPPPPQTPPRKSP
jgi:hypothetical protein